MEAEKGEGDRKKTWRPRKIEVVKRYYKIR